MTRHHVLLYNPKAVFYTMPLALLAVGSALNGERFRVSIVDGRLEQNPEQVVCEKISDALCLGVSVLSGAPIRDALRISRAAKAARPDLPVVWGGWHPSLFPLQTVEERSVDATVIGQGEATFVELVNRIAGGETIDGVPGTASRVSGQGVRHAPRQLVDASRLQTHDYELLPVERYFERKARRQLDYVSSVGCVHRCAFCADPLVYGRRWSGLEPGRVADEIAYLWRRYGFDDVSFQDEAFFTDAERVAAVAEGFLARKLGVSWRASLRPDQGVRLSDEMLALYQRSGLRRVMIGAESGSQDILDLVRKDTDVEDIIGCAEKLLRRGIAATFSFIVGFPGESDASVRATIDLVKRLRRMSGRFETPVFYFKPYGGDGLGKEAARRGYDPPATLEEWASFDYVDSAGPWVSREKRKLVGRFKFYSRFAWQGDGGHPLLQAAARWRCERDEYRLPVEKVVVEALSPGPRLS